MSKTHLHAARCDVWDLLPEGDGTPVSYDRSSADGGRYGAAIRPIYDDLGRAMAQLSGLFLLRLTGNGSGLHLDHDMYKVACEKLAEARARLADITPPSLAARHHGALAELAGHLSEAALAMDRLAARQSADEAGRKAVLRHLHCAQQLLVAAAEPDAGVTPIDFSNACCSCGAPTGRLNAR